MYITNDSNLQSLLEQIKFDLPNKLPRLWQIKAQQPKQQNVISEMTKSSYQNNQWSSQTLQSDTSRNDKVSPPYIQSLPKHNIEPKEKLNTQPISFSGEKLGDGEDRTSKDSSFGFKNSIDDEWLAELGKDKFDFSMGI